MRGWRWLGMTLGFGAILASWPADGHAPGVSSSRIVRHGSTVTVELMLLASDYERATGTRLSSARNGTVDPAALAAHEADLVRYVTRHATVTTDGKACEPSAEPPRPDQMQVHVLVTVTWRCPDGTAAPSYRVSLFQDVDPAARHIVLIATGEGDEQALLDRSSPEVVLAEGTVSLFRVVGRFVRAGIEHILIGYDHIAFLLAVILWGRRFWPLVKVVTAFTVGHSITLSLAALDIIVLPSALVEAAIAASIVYVALENFFIHKIDRRWRITGLLGLVHGLGFASVLKEYGLPSDALAVALASFNIGVEIGQVAIVAVSVPLLMLGARGLDTLSRGAIRQPAMVYAGSGVIAALGLYWLAERIVMA